jgi:threonine/homoserine/homoserine lactone efflux protein
LLPDVHDWLLFMAASFILLVTPGPAVLYIVTRSLSQGTAAGLVSALGLVVGGLVHVMAAVAGVSAILLTSDAAYGSLRWAGAAYLVYLGIRQLRGGAASGLEGAVTRVTPWQIFRQGVAVNVLNPKPALFFMALLPQFVDPQRGAFGQMLALGLSFLTLALITDSTWAVAAGRAGRALDQPRYRVLRDRVTGVAYIGLGLVAALMGRTRTG